MGMDVYGKKPKNEVGEYFRNSVWWWRPLASYITSQGPQQITGKCRYWQSNNGAGLSAADSLKLAAWLREEIASGRTATYAMEYQAHMDSLPQHECNWCHGTGTRTDAVGIENGMDKKVIDEDGHPRKWQTGWCNSCNGHGKVDDSDTHYPFSVENCVEFATFLENCGGFSIH